MPIPNHCLECDKPFTREGKYCKNCADSRFYVNERNLIIEEIEAEFNTVQEIINEEKAKRTTNRNR